MDQNLSAFLKTITLSEIGQALIDISDRGFNVLVGSTPSHPLLFDSYVDHPDIYNSVTNSDAAGAFQIMHRFWVIYKERLNLPDFSPDSQNLYAIQQIKESHALDDIEAGCFDIAIKKCAHIWASLPGSPYGQHTNNLDDLRTAYINYGGTIA